MTINYIFKIRNILCLLFCYLSLFAKGKDVNEYRIDTRISNDTLFVHLELDISETNQRQSYFLFSDEHKKITKVEVNGVPVLFLFINDTLLIAEQNEIASLKIEYEVFLNLYRFADAFILRRESNWYPYRKGETFTYNLTIADTSQYIITNGIKRSDTYFSDVTNEIHLLLLDKQKYELKTMDSQNAYFNFFRHKNDSSYRFDFFYNEFTNAFDFFSFYFDNPQIKREMNIVEIYDTNFVMCQSLENLILFGNFFSADIQDSSLCSWIPHEIAHQWWGNRIFFKDNELRLFLEESLTEYLKMQYVQYQYGLEGFNCIKSVYENNMLWLKDTVLPISNIQNLNSTESCIVVYTQVPYLLNNILNKHPEINFKTIISEFYHKHYRSYIDFEGFYHSITNAKFVNQLHDILFQE